METTAPGMPGPLQNGTLERKGKKRKVWYGHFFIPVAGKRRHKVIKIGYVSELTKTEAREELRKRIRDWFEQTEANIEELNLKTTPTVKDFIHNDFLPVRRGRWRESSRGTQEQVLNHLTKQFGDRPVTEVTRTELQVFIDSLTDKMAGTSIKHLCSLTRAVFDEALEQGIIERDPARKLALPANRSRSDKYFLPDWKTVGSVFDSVTDEQDSLTVQVAAMTSVRPSELFALRRRSFDRTRSRFVITETVYRRKLRPYAKTEKRCQLAVSIPEDLTQNIAAWMAKNPAPADSFLFPSTAGTPMQESNFLYNVLHPIRKKLKLPKLNFQVLRRTWTTLCDPERLMTDYVKLQIGHTEASNTAVTTYIQPIPAQQQILVNRAWEELQKARTASTVQ